MYDLLRRLTLGLLTGTAASASMADHESGARIDGADLTEMDCCWSPTMGLPPASFEETHPGAKLQGPASA